MRKWFHRHEAVNIFLMAVLFRIFVYAVSIMVMIGFENYTDGYSFAAFLNGWKRWDGNNYVVIAKEGYSWLVEGRPLFLVFYPGYPYLMRLLYLVLPNMELCGIVISVLAYAVACSVIYKLMLIDYSKQAAYDAVILISIFPFSFFFGAIMTESLFLLISVLTLYYIRKHKWAMSALLGALACFTRSTGALLAFALLAEIYLYYQPLRLLKEKQYQRAAGILCMGGVSCMGMAMGTAAYLGINYAVTGKPFAFLTFQKEHWSQSTGNLFETISYLWYYFKEDFYRSNGAIMWGPELILFFIGLLVIGYACKNCRATYSLYLVLYILLIYSLTWLLSAGRYLSCAVPLFMAGGIWMDKHPKGKIVLICVSSMFFMLFMIAYHTGRSTF